jgi:hypothetical protein
MLVSQSYNIFNRFGKDSTAIADITRAFIEDLQPYTIEQITKAFKQWRQTESGMPVPANIQDLIKNGAKKNDAMLYRLRDFDYNFKIYSSYLAAYGQLAPTLDHDHHDWEAYLKANGKWQG